jgi:uncharacterized protein YbbK (DUF523 family)
LAVILLSACLSGEACRYDGGHCKVDGLADLVSQGKAVVICPEVAGGMPVPREPSEVRVGPAGNLRVVTSSGKDVTRSFRDGAEAALKLVRKHGITSAVLKSLSPSCGCGRIPDGSFSGRLAAGNGITADLLRKQGVRICNEHNWEEMILEER